MSEPLEGVTLRPLRLDDAGRVLGWRNRPDVAAYMYTDHVISEVEHARWLALALAGAGRRYWIIELGGRPTGLAALTDISDQHQRAYCASYVADPALRGQGIGVAAERRLLEIGFRDLGLEKVCTEVLATNERGIALHERCQFQVDGRLRSHVVKGGRRVDVVTMSLLRSEWEATIGDTDG